MREHERHVADMLWLGESSHASVDVFALVAQLEESIRHRTKE